jgi:DNA-binding response OmpR family regulator
MRILVVEDERKVSQAVQQGLEGEGCHVTTAETGEEAFYLAQTEPFDVIVLDRMLPGRDGLEILSTLRARGVRTPVLMLTAKDAVEDRVAGLDAGADDYMVKPFAFSELAARTRALARRLKLDDASPLQYADLELDLRRRRATRSGRPLNLTIRELEILELMLRNVGHVVPRELLTREIWREYSHSSSLDNVIDVHVARLRRKLDDPSPVKLLHTVRGLGFVLEVRSP